MEKFTVSYFIEKFEKIPEESWCIDKIMDDEGRRCALGHCYPAHWNKQEINRNIIQDECGALVNLIRVVTINNGFDPKYQQPTPKQRILAALYDVRAKLNRDKGVQVSDTTKAQSSEEAGKQKTIYKYVKVSKEIEEMEFVEN